jgi:hypothetical protein
MLKRSWILGGSLCLGTDLESGIDLKTGGTLAINLEILFSSLLGVFVFLVCFLDLMKLILLVTF